MKQRVDFVWVRPTEGHGSAGHHSAHLHVTCTREEPQEVTRAEWEHILKRRGMMELCEPPKPKGD